MSDLISTANAVAKRERWEYIKSLRVVPRMFWNSSEYGTYHVGSNRRKREQRAIKKTLNL